MRCRFLINLALSFVLLLGIGGISHAGTLDVYDWDFSHVTPIGQIDTIDTAETGAQHYDYFSDSGHPSNVNLGTYNSSFWVQEDTDTGELTFGFIFSIDNSSDSSNQAELYFRIVNSLTDVYVSQSDDPGEAVETSPGWFHGNFNYGHNTDGIAVSGITGSDWTIMIDSVDFGDITNWYAASGEVAGFSDDLTLTLGHEYRITPAGNTPSGAPVNPVPEPSLLILLSIGLAAAGLVGHRNKRP